MIQIPGHVIKKLYQLMYDFDKLAYKCHIQYWVASGTLLGVMRHKGIIPWDDDLDVCISKEYIKVINSKKFIDLLKGCGYKLTKTFYGYKIGYMDSNIEWISLDVFVMKNDDNVWSYNSKKARDIWSKEYIYKKELFPLQRMKFGSFLVTAPADPKKVLNRWFPEWNKKAYQTYDHKKDEPLDPIIEIQLNKNTKRPALPMTIKRKSCNADNKFPNIYFINCASHKKRLSSFKAQFGRDSHINSPIPMRIPCVNGKRWGKSMICQKVNEGTLKYKADLTPIEVSITLSHIKAIKKFLSRNEPYGIIMEDDAILKKNFVKNINKIILNVPNFDILYIFNNNIFETSNKLEFVRKITKNIDILRETVPHNPSGVAYMVSRNFAQYLVDNAFPIKDQWDTYIGYSSFRKRFKYYTVNMPFMWGSHLVKIPPWSKDQTTQEVDNNFKSEKHVYDYEC